MPRSEATMSRRADGKSTVSRLTTSRLRLMVNPAKVTTGDAVEILMIILSKGMARSASPKPTAARMKAQRDNSTAVIRMRVIGVYHDDIMGCYGVQRTRT